MLRLGVDIGSKSVKLVALDESGAAAFSSYEMHRACVGEALGAAAAAAAEALGAEASACVCLTGSAGLGAAAALGLPHVQEVVACTRAAGELLPEVDALVELGGEDAKIVYLGSHAEQRMNSACAGGTGAFLEAVAGMLGVEVGELDALARGASLRYPIASRCAVFAQTDIRPLLAAGAKPADIAASAFAAVVQQTLGSLAAGRPLRGRVAFLGGPLEHLPTLVDYFRSTLGLSFETGVKPEGAHLFGAHGAALEASGEAISLKEFAAACASLELEAGGLEFLPALFASAAEQEEFAARHASCAFAEAPLKAATGPLFVGIDAGSTTLKLAAVDAAGTLVHSDYRFNSGSLLEAAREMHEALSAALPEGAWIERTAACGYGEELLRREALADDGLVETAAHLRAAQALAPDVDFVLDIGGQDMKALWVAAGQVADTALNEACSSGCGAFIEESAQACGMDSAAFAELAAQAESAVDLGTRCTVFMNSRIRHAQRSGASLAQIAAGISYAVVKNAFRRIIGRKRAATLGPRVVVSGGTFKSDAVLRALELELGRNVVRAQQSHLMGAIGAALYACETQGQNVAAAAAADDLPPNAFEIERQTYARFTSVAGSGSRGHFAIGMMNTMNNYGLLPIWHALFAALGFTVLMPRAGCENTCSIRAWETVPSESVCRAAKLSHARYWDLCDQGANVVFFPIQQRRSRCEVAPCYAHALADGLGADDVPLITDYIQIMRPRWLTSEATTRNAIFELCQRLSRMAGVELSEEDFSVALQAAANSHDITHRARMSSSSTVNQWLAADPSRRAIMLAGRPYHFDPALSHGIDVELQRMGFAVMSLNNYEGPGSPGGMGFGGMGFGGDGWQESSTLVSAARSVAANAQVDMVFLQAFGCGFDAIGVAEAQRVLEEAGAPSLTIKIDDIADMAHIRVRLRTFAQAIARPRAFAAAAGAASHNYPAETNWRALLATPLGARDAELAQTCGVKDACLVANLLAARTVALMSEDASITNIAVPQVCSQCLADAAFTLARRNCERVGNFTYVHCANSWGIPEAERVQAAYDAGAGIPAAGEAPRVGIVGNPLVCYEPQVNGNICSQLEALGCTPVLPEPRLMDTSDVRYLPQLEAFAAAGIREVVYLLPFGCLKGHVWARGSLHGLAKQFPTLHISVLDVDLDTSPTNLQNRLALIAATAKRP